MNADLADCADFFDMIFFILKYNIYKKIHIQFSRYYVKKIRAIR